MHLVPCPVQEPGIDEDHALAAHGCTLQVDGGATLLIHDAHLAAYCGLGPALLDPGEQRHGEGDFLRAVHLRLHDIHAPRRELLCATSFLRSWSAIMAVNIHPVCPSGIFLPARVSGWRRWSSDGRRCAQHQAAARAGSACHQSGCKFRSGLQRAGQLSALVEGSVRSPFIRPSQLRYTRPCPRHPRRQRNPRNPESWSARPPGTTSFTPAASVAPTAWSAGIDLNLDVQAVVARAPRWSGASALPVIAAD